MGTLQVFPDVLGSSGAGGVDKGRQAMKALRRIALSLAALGMIAGTAVGLTGTPTASGAFSNQGQTSQIAKLADTGWD